MVSNLDKSSLATGVSELTFYSLDLTLSPGKAMFAISELETMTEN
jgi:hypothetical protein